MVSRSDRQIADPESIWYASLTDAAQKRRIESSRDIRQMIVDQTWIHMKRMYVSAERDSLTASARR